MGKTTMTKDTKNAIKLTFRTPEYCDNRSFLLKAIMKMENALLS